MATRTWVRREQPPTAEETIRCGGIFRVIDVTRGHGMSFRYYDYTDGTWSHPQDQSNEGGPHWLLANSAFSHWLREDFPPTPG